MGIFSKLFGDNNKEDAPTDNPSTPSTPADEEQADSISFMLLYKELPMFDKPTLQKSLTDTFRDALDIQMLLADEKTLMINAKLEANELTVACLTFSYPKQILEEILPICHFSEEDKSTFHQSEAHVLVSIKKNDTPIHLLFDTLYRVADCLIQQGNKVIGTVTEAGLTAFPLKSIQGLSGEREALIKEKAIPFWSWMAFTGGFVKYILDDTTIWYVTKGNHQFGLPELAYKGGYTEGNDTLILFKTLFSYMYSYEAKLAPGHTAEIGATNLKFSTLTEYADIFMGKHGTLVVNRV
ncbi:MAG: DUF4261 domain-containing protein [Aureispira sp.]|nr:DUF4261 domain-containing protein [Aureispira sp.]